MKPLLQSDIERAMKYTRSNAAAARFLGVNYNTYKKYAKRYFDKNGDNLFELHKNQAGVSISKVKLNSQGERFSLDDVLANKFPGYALQKLKHRLVNQALIYERCELCGFEERRVTDQRMPLLLSFKEKEGDYSLENLELLCFNCYFLTVGNIVGRKQEEKIGETR